MRPILVSIIVVAVLVGFASLRWLRRRAKLSPAHTGTS